MQQEHQPTIAPQFTPVDPPPKLTGSPETPWEAGADLPEGERFARIADAQDVLECEDGFRLGFATHMIEKECIQPTEQWLEQIQVLSAGLDSVLGTISAESQHLTEETEHLAALENKVIQQRKVVLQQLAKSQKSSCAGRLIAFKNLFSRMPVVGTAGWLVSMLTRGIETWVGNSLESKPDPEKPKWREDLKDILAIIFTLGYVLLHIPCLIYLVWAGLFGQEWLWEPDAQKYKVLSDIWNFIPWATIVLGVSYSWRAFHALTESAAGLLDEWLGSRTQPGSEKNVIGKKCLSRDGKRSKGGMSGALIESSTGSAGTSLLPLFATRHVAARERYRESLRQAYTLLGQYGQLLQVRPGLQTDREIENSLGNVLQQMKQWIDPPTPAPDTPEGKKIKIDQMFRGIENALQQPSSARAPIDPLKVNLISNAGIREASVERMSVWLDGLSRSANELDYWSSGGIQEALQLFSVENSTQRNVLDHWQQNHQALLWYGGFVHKCTGQVKQIEQQLVIELEEYRHKAARATLKQPYGEGHLLTVGPNGSGKNRTVIMPNLMTYPHSVVVIDVKGENYAVTARARREMGQQVILLDPFRCVRGMKIDAPVAGFNPLELVRNSAYPQSLARMIAHSLLAVMPNDDETAAGLKGDSQKYLEALILHTTFRHNRAKDRTLEKLRRKVTSPNLEKTFARMVELGNTDSGQRVSRRMSHVATNFFKANRNRRDAIVDTMYEATDFLDDERVEQCLNRTVVDIGGNTPWNIQDLRAGKLSIYLVIPSHELAHYGALLRLWLYTLFRPMFEGTARNRKRVLFLVDEMGQLGSMDRLLEMATIGRGYGINLWMFLQSIAQLENLFQAEGAVQTLVNNLAGLHVLSGFAKEEAEYFSQFLGKRWFRRVEQSAGTATSDGYSAGASESHGTSSSGSTSNSKGYDQFGEHVRSSESQTSGSGTSQEKQRSVNFNHSDSRNQSIRESWDLFELMTTGAFRRNTQSLVIRQGAFPLLADKVDYEHDPELTGLYDNNPLSDHYQENQY